MTKMKLLAAAAMVSSLIATPVLAQDSMQHRAQMRQTDQQYSASQVAYRHGDNYRARDDNFWPGEVAAGVVGGAIGTAGAIASAPFQPWGDNWNNSYNSSAPPRDSYAQRMGFVCEPGTLFRGEDGRRHICQ